MNKRIKGLLTVAAGVALVAAGATAASAHDAQASLSCDDWSVSASNYPAGSSGTVIVDGVTDFSGTFDHGGQRSGVFTDETVDTHRLQVSITSPDGWPEFVVDETVTDCAVVTPPTEQPPVVVPHIQDYIGNCDAAFVLDNTGSTLPVVYTINGTRYIVEAGTAVHTDADGTRIAPMDGGYSIVTDTGRKWFFPARECPVVTPPETTPPVTVPPSDEPPVVTPDPTPSEPVETPEPSEPVELISPVSGEVVYGNCAAAIEAGIAPIRSGEPGYSLDLDGDANGVACDSYTAPASTSAAPVTPADTNAAPTLPQTGPDLEPLPVLILASLLLVLGVVLSVGQSIRHRYPKDGDDDDDR